MAGIMMINEPRSTSSYWSFQLKRTRAMREKLLSSDNADIVQVDGEEFLHHVCSMKEDIRKQLLNDCSCAVDTTAEQQYKQLRLCLRVALCCLSIPPNHRCHDEVRRTIQVESFDCWYPLLLTMIMNKDIDESCRLLAAQVLCNTITDCIETAARFMNGIPPAPTETAIAQKLRHDVFLEHSSLTMDVVQATGSSMSLPTNPTSVIPHGLNWVDLILTSSTSRPLLAVVVACLHNCICSVTKANTESGGNCVDDSIDKIAASTLLISTLLRHIVASALFVQSVQNVVDTPTTNAATTTDEATEWTIILISKLCRLGLLPKMYQSIGSSTGSNDTKTVYPEHVVLLHSLRNIMEEGRYDNVEIKDSNSDVGKKYSRCFYLGGESKMDDGQSMIDSHCFLAGLYVTISSARSESSSGTSAIDRLQASVLQLVLDILAESLSEDSNISTRIRNIIGSTTTFLQSIVCDLSNCLDQWHEENKTLFARDQAKMNEIDQCRITASVRVIGNLCFHCRPNQDLLRSIILPNSAQHDNLRSEKSQRNGLHVLLSTTSMSYACFTLREWAVVAIRSVLEDCPENQAIVLELEGQLAMQTADLEDMGIRVNLNVPTGTVTVDQLHDKEQ